MDLERELDKAIRLWERNPDNGFLSQRMQDLAAQVGLAKRKAHSIRLRFLNCCGRWLCWIEKS